MRVPPISDHTGGVNALFADGAVRFIADTIDCNGGGTEITLEYPGQSPYGVFGALGTPTGGESQSL